jgi:raffinose/stachyose/melibiose transport system substrate-binding protein
MVSVTAAIVAAVAGCGSSSSSGASTTSASTSSATTSSASGTASSAAASTTAAASAPASTSGSVATSAASGGGAKTDLSFFSWDNQQTMQPLIDKFQAENPNITIKFSTAPPVAAYISALQTRLLSKTAADVFIYTAEDAKVLAKGGFAKDLTAEPFTKVMSIANRNFMTNNGKVYGLSVSSWAGGIMYNKALLAKVGVTTEPKTWDEFLALCAKLKAAGITPYYDGVQSGNVMSLQGLIGGNYAVIGNQDAKIFAGQNTFASAWATPLTEYDQLFTNGYMPKTVVGLSDDQVMSEFTGGRVAMIAGAPWNVGTVRKSAPNLDFSFMPVPGATAPYWVGAASPGYAINSSTKHLAAAEKFLTFLGSAEGAALYNKSANAITTTSNFVPTVDPALTELAQGARAGKLYLTAVSWPGYQSPLGDEFKAQIQELAQGKTTPAAVAKDLDTKLKQLLK